MGSPTPPPSTGHYLPPTKSGHPGTRQGWPDGWTLSRVCAVSMGIVLDLHFLFDFSETPCIPISFPRLLEDCQFPVSLEDRDDRFACSLVTN